MYYVKDRNIDVNLLRVRETGYRFLLYSIIHQYIAHFLPPTMASILRHKEPKGDHYNAQLTHALLKGNWADPTAGNAPNGTALSWSELFRKWGKHTGGSESVRWSL